MEESEGFVAQLTEFLVKANDILWGWPMLILLLGTGIYLTLGLGFMPIRKLGAGFALLWQGRKSGKDNEGEISPFNALMTALSATIGTGNIAGVALAIVAGGPGALFWMWITALIGMATKFAEAVLAVKYREVDELGNHVGGPMYYIKNGLGQKWAWLGFAFAFFGALAGFGLGNTVQAREVANVFDGLFGIDPKVTGVIMAVLVGLVILGGIKRIAQVTGVLVTFMGIAYFSMGLLVLIINAGAIPSAFALIFEHAFTGEAAAGGVIGIAIMQAIRQGVARGIFSNEAGLGSAPIAHAAAQTNDPIRQGLIGMLGTFIDTIIVCTVTGLAIVTSGLLMDRGGLEGAELTRQAFELALPGIGGYVVAVSLAVFAFTTILGWSVYGERCSEYIFGVKSIMPFRILWTLAVPLGAYTVILDRASGVAGEGTTGMAAMGLVWKMSDMLNALMAFPNLIALLLLSPVVFSMTKEYFKK